MSGEKLPIDAQAIFSCEKLSELARHHVHNTTPQELFDVFTRLGENERRIFDGFVQLYSESCPQVVPQPRTNQTPIIPQDNYVQ